MEKKDRFSLRKLKSGVVSVALGSLLVVAGTVTAEASPTDGNDQDVPKEEQLLETPDESEGETQAVESDDLIVEVDTGETEEVVVSEPVVERHDGLDREEVAINVAEKHFSGAEKAVIVNQDTYTDAISATNISRGDFPVLYTRADKLGDKTLVSLGKMKNLKEIYLLGGTTSINDSVKDRLTDTFGDIVTRIDGLDRFEANANAIREGYTEGKEMKADHVVIATGEIYTDALYGVSYANTINAPIILSKTDRLVQESLDLIKELGATQVTIIGGKSSVTDAVKAQLSLNVNLENINRIAGANRYDGSALVAKNAYENPKTVLVASGDIFTDALVSAPLAQKLDAPIILVRKDSTVGEVKAYLKEVAPTVENIYIQGGTSTVDKANENEIKDLATNKTDEAVLIKAILTVQVTGENEVTARFVNEEEKYDETHTFTTGELNDGEDNIVTFTYNDEDYAVNFLYVTAEKFVETVRKLPSLGEIENITTIEGLEELEEAIAKADNFYNALTEKAKDNEEVIEKMDWISAKKKTIKAREAKLALKVTVEDVDENTVQVKLVNEEGYNETETIELKEPLDDGVEKEITFEHAGRDYTVTVLYVTAEKFVETVQKLPSLGEIEDMKTIGELDKLEESIAEADKFYVALPEGAKTDVPTNKEVTEKKAWIDAKKKTIEARKAVLQNQ